MDYEALAEVWTLFSALSVLRLSILGESKWLPPVADLANEGSPLRNRMSGGELAIPFGRTAV